MDIKFYFFSFFHIFPLFVFKLLIITPEKGAYFLLNLLNNIYLILFKNKNLNEK